jgi:hypothetical protein
MAISRRTVLKTAIAATGAALAGAGTYEFTNLAHPATAPTTAPAGAAPSATAGPSAHPSAAAPSATAGPSSSSHDQLVSGARVGATVNPRAYPAGTSWVEAMADFNAQVGRNLEVAKRYYEGPGTWPTQDNIGVRITSLVQRNCRGLLCFQPNVDGTDLGALMDSLQAIKTTGQLTDAKVTLWTEQGITEGLTAAEFRQVYAKYQPIRSIFPLFVDFSGSNPTTWQDYNPGTDLVDGIAVDFYAEAFLRGLNIEPLAELANQAGMELGIWEMGVGGSTLRADEQLMRYFEYLTGLQSARLNNGHLVGDMAWYNGPYQDDWSNTISGIRLAPLHKTGLTQLASFYDMFNGVK